MKKGTIIKGISSFYYVAVGENVYECKARGRFKNAKHTPLVGDVVHIEVQDAIKFKGSIEQIEDRQVELIRPAIANVDQAVIVFAGAHPDPHPSLIDKLTVLCEYSDLEIVICLNKSDLPHSETVSRFSETYRAAGYHFVETSIVSNEGLETLRFLLKGKVNVFAGPSGVGKSSLLNAIQEGLALKTGDVSEKIKRGRHTTRHTELIALNEGGFVADTPGFTSLEIDFIDKDELSGLFPDFLIAENCKFKNCLHINEPGCGIKEAVASGKIAKTRYQSYVQFMKDIEETQSRRYK